MKRYMQLADYLNNNWSVLALVVMLVLIGGL